MIDYGYNQAALPWGNTYMNEAAVRAVLQVIKDLGGSRVRMAVQLGSLTDLDRAVNLSVEYGLKPLLCFIDNPAFGYDGSVVGYANMCKTVALRYGPAGTGQVSEYEIANEANVSPNPPRVASGTAFADYLKAGYTAIKSVHTSSTVIAGGTIPTVTIPNGFILIPWPPFIIFGSASDPVKWYTDLYAAGCKNFMDALGFHFYVEEAPTPTVRQWKYLTDVRQVMLDNGDDQKKVWVTEVGVGFPAPGVADLVMARDWLKIMVEAIIGYDWCGPFYVYAAANYSGGDGAGGTYGMVDVNGAPRSPVNEYAATIVGTPADPGDIVPPDPPTSVEVSDGVVTWDPATDDFGVTAYRIYDTTGARLAQTLQTSIPLASLHLAPGTAYTLYVTAIDAAGNESDPSALSDPFTTDSPTGLQAFFQYDFTGTGSTLPTVFSQLGLGFTVTGGVALPVPPSSDSDVYTVAPYWLDLQSPDHYSEIAQDTASAHPDRAAFTVVRATEDGSQWAAATITNGPADACRIVTYDGTVTVRAARNTSPLLPGEKLRCTALGNVYTASRISNGVETELLSWTDTNGEYAGSGNVRPGLGWRHKRVGSVNYPPPGITGVWKAADLNAVQGSGGVTDAWMLGITPDDDWPLVIATGLWEIAT